MITESKAVLTPSREKLLQGKVAIVTGSARGIGACIAQELGLAGAKVVVNYARSATAANQLVEDFRSQEIDAIAVQGNVARLEDAQRLVEATLAEFGQVDILVNNAGITRDKTLRRMDPESWREVIQTNLDSVYYCTSAVLPHMVEQNFGRVVSISSIIGQTGGFGQTNYAASKAGILGFTKSMAREVAKYGITVNAVCPGYIETDMLGEVPEKVRQALLAQIPLSRFGQPEEVARMVRFLCAEADWVTGQEFNINGGQYM